MSKAFNKVLAENIIEGIELKLDEIKDEMDEISCWDIEWLDLCDKFTELARHRLKLIKDTEDTTNE